MRIRSLVILFCLLAASDVMAQASGMEVRPAGRELLEAKPREIVTTTFRVTNTSSKQYEFVSDIQLPEGWALITEDFPFYLGPDESCTKPVSFFVPQTCPAGSYKITYLVRARKYPAIRDFYTIDVKVLQHNRLEVKLLEAPGYIIAGQDCRVRFCVANKSNTENSIRVDIDSSENIPFTIDSRIFKLAPGQTKVVDVTIKPDVKITKILKHRLQLTAQIVGNSKSKAQADATHLAEIIPNIGAVEQSFGAVAPQVVLGRLSKKSKEAKHKPSTETTYARVWDEQQTDSSVYIPSASPKRQDKSTADTEVLKKKTMQRMATV